MSSFRDSIPVSVFEKFKYTFACVEILRGIKEERAPFEKLVNYPAVHEYLELFKGRAYNVALDELAALYVEFKDKDEDVCREAIHDTIDQFSIDGRRISNGFLECDFASFVGYLANHYGCKTVFEPFAGTAGLAQLLPFHTSYIGQEINSHLYQLAQLRMEYLGVEHGTMMQGDSFFAYPDCDLIVSEMPWGLIGLGKKRSESFFLQEAPRAARQISMGIYPYAVLFRQGKEKEIRSKLIENDLVEFVIKLPNQLYAPYSRVQSCIVITNQNKARKGFVRFIDASNCIRPNLAYTRLDTIQLVKVMENLEAENREILWVSNEDILRNNANLAMEEYLPVEIEQPEGYSVVALKEVLSTINVRKSTDEPNIPVLMVSDLAFNPFDFTLGEKDAPLHKANRSFIYVDEPALLISRLRPLKPTYFVAKCGGVYINPNVFAFRVNTDIVSPQYLLNELTKDYVQKQLIYAGAVIPSLTYSTFLNVKILLPSSREEQDLIVVKSLQLEKERGEEDIAGAKNILDAELRQRQHTLGHAAADVVILCHQLEEQMQKHGGVLRRDDIVNKKEETVAELMQKLLFASDRVGNLTKNLSIKREFGDATPIDLLKFLIEFKNNHHMPKFAISFVNDAKVYPIMFASDDLLAVMENIFANISKHSFPMDGFSEKNKVVARFSILEQTGQVELLIMSNGAPLDASMNPEDVFMWGKTTDKDNPEHGYGGNQVKTAIEHFGGEVSFLTAPDIEKGFTTAYRIVLPLKTA